MDYSKLYQSIYKGLRESNSSNVHRRAAAQARTAAQAAQHNNGQNQNEAQQRPIP